MIICIQQKSGMRLIVSPGARMRRIVTMKLMAPLSDATPSRMMPITQKSMLGPGAKHPCPPFAAVCAAASVLCWLIVPHRQPLTDGSVSVSGA